MRHAVVCMPALDAGPDALSTSGDSPAFAGAVNIQGGGFIRQGTFPAAISRCKRPGLVRDHDVESAYDDRRHVRAGHGGRAAFAGPVGPGPGPLALALPVAAKVALAPRLRAR